MSASTFKASSDKISRLILIAGFLVFIFGIAFAWLQLRQQMSGPFRVLLINESSNAEAKLDAQEIRAIGLLVQDHLEHWGGHAITATDQLPKDVEPLRRHPHVLLLRLRPQRRGDLLVLRFQWARSENISPGGNVSWTAIEPQALPPAQAFEAFVRTLPMPFKHPPSRVLLPKNDASFWSLIASMAARLGNENLERAHQTTETLSQLEPQCPTVWFLLSGFHYHRLINNSPTSIKDHEACEATLLKGLALAPLHPRGTYLLAQIKIDSGNQREALELLAKARESQPYNPILLTGIAYAARGAGLLPLALQAMKRRDKLTFSEYQPQAVDVTYLYAFEWARFEAGLRKQPGRLWSTSGALMFYQGYLELIRGNREAALVAFLQLRRLPKGYPLYTRLGSIFQLILEQRTEEAREALRAYDETHSGLRVLHGEFTLRLAEAYALLGDRVKAMEVAARAFAQGFSCTQWYECSPLLESIRNLPKWKPLVQHLKERQVLYEERFPKERFGL